MQFIHILNVDNVDNVDREEPSIIIANHLKSWEFRRIVRETRIMEKISGELCQSDNAHKNPHGMCGKNVYNPVDNVDNYAQSC